MMEIASLFTCFAEATMMFMICETFLKKRDTLHNVYYIFGLLLLAILIKICNIKFGTEEWNVICMAASCFVVSFLYTGKITTRLIISVLSFLIMVSIEMLVLYTIALVFDVTVQYIMKSYVFSIFGMIVSKMMSILIVNLIRIKLREKLSYADTKFWVLFCVMFVTSTATIFLIFELTQKIQESRFYSFSFLCSFGILFSTFIALYLYERIVKQTVKLKIQEQKEKYLKIQANHAKEIEATLQEIIKFKHNYKNDLIGLRSYLDKNNCAGAKEFLEETIEDVDFGDNIIDTGNITLDAIISAKKSLAESKKIQFKLKTQIPKEMPISSDCICDVFGNALDNAIEACEKTSDNRIIDVLLIVKDGTLFCKITNTTTSGRKNIFKTLKPDKENHGFGIRSIEQALEKYESKPIFEQKENLFTMKFTITNVMERKIEKN